MKHKACIITTKKFKAILITTLCILISVLFITASSAGIRGAINGLNMCADILIPTLFPFCVISTFVIRSQISNTLGEFLSPIGKLLFNTNGNTTCTIFLSMLSGYPVGARLIRLLYEQKQISKKHASSLICCCVNPGPAFIVLAVGKGILNNQLLGYVLLLANVISCIIINIIFRSNEHPQAPKANAVLNYSDAFVQSVSDAASSVMSLCAFVVLFSSLQSIANTIFGKQLQIALTALSEVTTSIIYFRHNIFLIAILLGWCGFCVHAQVLSMCGKLMPNYVKFIAIRLFHGLLIAGITELLIKIFHISISVSNITSAPVYSGTSASVPCAIALMITCVIFMLSTNKNTLGKLNKV